MELPAADVAALSSLATAASVQARPDQPSLKLGGGPHDLTQEAAVGVGGVIALHTATLSGLEDLNAVAQVPGVGQNHLLNMEFAGKSVETMHHDAVRLALLDGEKSVL
jgi:hypothetical protein